MTIESFALHRFYRVAPQTNIITQQSAQTVNGLVEDCFRQLKQLFLSRSGKIYGQFSNESAEARFSAELRQVSEGKLSHARFVEKCIEDLATRCSDIDAVPDGYFMCIHEKLQHEESLYLFYIEHDFGPFIDGDLALSETVFLDLRNLKLAAKVDMMEWQRQNDGAEATGSEESYLTIAPWRGEPELSGLFLSSVGFADQRDIKKETTQLLEAVSAYARKYPEEQVQVVKSKVVDYCLEQEKDGQAVELKALSAHVNEDNTKDFSHFVSQYSPLRAPKLYPDKTQLRNYVRISGRDDNLSMSFAAAHLGKSIFYDPATESLTIQHIPKALKTRILKYLQEEILTGESIGENPVHVENRAELENAE